MPLLPALVALTGPLRDVAPGRATDLLRTELSRPEYHADDPPLVQRVLEYALRRLGDLLSYAASVAPGGRGGLFLLLVALVALGVGVRMRVGPLGRLRRAAGPPAVGGTLDAAGHRALADAAAAQERWADAVRERLRAVVRGLEEAGVIDVRPGRTALEVARDAGRAAPDLLGDLLDGAVVFDEVWYGGRAAGPADDARLRTLDAHVTATLTGAGAR